MPLYLVLHHRDDQSKPFPNDWLDDNRVNCISTTNSIARKCAEKMKKKERVLIYRCQWGNEGAVICCSALIESAETTVGLVKFKDQKTLSLKPPRHAHRGESDFES